MKAWGRLSDNTIALSLVPIATRDNNSLAICRIWCSMYVSQLSEKYIEGYFDYLVSMPHIFISISRILHQVLTHFQSKRLKSLL